MQQPVKTNLIDSSFQSPSFTLCGDNVAEAPKLIAWDRSVNQDGPIFFTDKHLKDVLDFTGDKRKKIALLIEPPSLSMTHYHTAWELKDAFDHILTFHTQFWQIGKQHAPDKILYYPLGGSWIAPDLWQAWPKTRKISMVLSEKTGAPGHKMRHWIAGSYRERIDVFGRGFNPVKSKVTALAPYEFSIVVESVRIPGYFSEKLIDCLAVGTTPVYWGAPDIEKWFGNGIVTFEAPAQLKSILRRPDLYVQADEVKEELLQTAKTLRCAEDRIYLHYGWIWQ